MESRDGDSDETGLFDLSSDISKREKMLKQKTEEDANRIGFLVRIDETGKVEIKEHKGKLSIFDLFEYVRGNVFLIPRITTQTPFHAWGLVDYHYTSKPVNNKATALLRQLKFNLPDPISGNVVIISAEDNLITREHAKDLVSVADAFPADYLEPIAPQGKSPSSTRRKTDTTKHEKKTVKAPKSGVAKTQIPKAKRIKATKKIYSNF